jgi:4-aminobutyrate aminotransferase
MDFYFDVMAKYGQNLTEKVQIKGNGKNKVFFANSGAEAWEGAIKLARYKTGRPNIIAFYGAFHGRTLAAISANASKTRQRAKFGPLASGFYHSFYPNENAVNKSVPHTTEACIAFLKEYLFTKMVSPDEVAAIVMEPIQGEGGYIVPSKEFVQEIRKICDEHGILLIADEIQSGFGRTGKFGAIEHFDVKPDIVCLAKGIASGLPLAAFVANETVMDWPVAVHGSTFGGNPVAMAAAAKTLELIEGGLMENAGKVGTMMLNRLKTMQKKYDIINDVRGIGMMIGVEIGKDGKLDGALREKIIEKCFEKGMLLLACGASTVRICPPLVLTAEQANVGLDIFEEVLQSL